MSRKKNTKATKKPQNEAGLDKVVGGIGRELYIPRAPVPGRKLWEGPFTSEIGRQKRNT